MDESGDYQLRYLVARVDAPVEAGVYSVSLGLAGRQFTVRFRGLTGVSEYPIALDRLPFAEAARVLSVEPVVLSDQSPGLSAEIRTLRLDAARLY